jgi:hypothetical protein
MTFDIGILHGWKMHRQGGMPLYFLLGFSRSLVPRYGAGDKSRPAAATVGRGAPNICYLLSPARLTD